jgi:antiviral helicase SKI2
LSYNLWAGKDLHKIMQGKSGFLEKGYRDAAQALLPASAKDPKKKDTLKSQRRPASGSKSMAWQVQGDKSNWVSLVHYLDRFVMTPTVIFSFSKKKCEEIARMLQSIDLNTSKERSAVRGFTIQALSRLSENDAKLPQVELLCEMVQRGIGIHHGGLLPILKETVEILFSRNLIKILLATESK